MVDVYGAEPCPFADVCFLFSAFKAHAYGEARTGCLFAGSGGDLFLLQVVAMFFSMLNHCLIIAEKVDDCFQGNLYRTGIRVAFKKAD